MAGMFEVPRGVREQALYASFLNMVPGLLMAGARSPNPAQAAQGYGAAIQGFGQGGRDYMNDWRNMQALGFATRKAEREETAAARQARAAAMLTGGVEPGAAPPIDWRAMSEADPRYKGTVAEAYPNAAPALWSTRDVPQRSATERMIDARNRLLMKQSAGALTGEELLTLNSYNDALTKGYVVPEGGNLTRYAPGQGTSLPTPGAPAAGATQVGPATPIPPQAQAAVPSQLEPQQIQRNKPLPRDVQDDLTSGLSMKRSLDQIAAGLHKSGRIQGNVEKAKIWLGIGSQEGLDFDTAQKNFRVAAQALIKGIPSNFDVQTFIDTLPDLGQPEPTNTARYEFAMNTLRELVATKIGYYKGLQYEIPDEINALAAELGIRDAPPLSAQAATARFNTLQAGMKKSRGVGATTNDPLGIR